MKIVDTRGGWARLADGRFLRDAFLPAQAEGGSAQAAKTKAQAQSQAAASSRWASKRPGRAPAAAAAVPASLTLAFPSPRSAKQAASHASMHALGDGYWEAFPQALGAAAAKAVVAVGSTWTLPTQSQTAQRVTFTCSVNGQAVGTFALPARRGAASAPVTGATPATATFTHRIPIDGTVKLEVN